MYLFFCNSWPLGLKVIYSCLHMLDERQGLWNGSIVLLSVLTVLLLFLWGSLTAPSITFGYGPFPPLKPMYFLIVNTTEPLNYTLPKTISEVTLPQEKYHCPHFPCSSFYHSPRRGISSVEEVQAAIITPGHFCLSGHFEVLGRDNTSHVSQHTPNFHRI